jgi:hypothetical protein
MKKSQNVKSRYVSRTDLIQSKQSEVKPKARKDSANYLVDRGGYFIWPKKSKVV